MKPILTIIAILILAMPVMSEERAFKLTITITYNVISLKNAMALEKKLDQFFKCDTMAQINFGFGNEIPKELQYPYYRGWINAISVDTAKGEMSPQRIIAISYDRHKPRRKTGLVSFNHTIVSVKYTTGVGGQRPPAGSSVASTPARSETCVPACFLIYA